MRRRLTLFLAAGALGVLAWISRSEPMGSRSLAAPDVDAWAAAPSCAVSLTTDGPLEFGCAGAPPRPLGRLASRDAAAQRATLDLLRVELEGTRIASGGDRGQGSDVVLRMDVGADVPWSHVLWILEVASGPSVRIHRLRLGLRGAPGSAVPHDLDPVVGIYARQESLRILSVRLRAEAESPGSLGHAWASVSMALMDLPMGAAPHDGDSLDHETSWATYAGVRKLTARVRGGTSVSGGILDVPRSDRLRVKYGEVFTVLRALADEDVYPVQFLHRAMTLPGDR